MNMETSLTLDNIPCTDLPGVGAKLAKTLAKRGIYTLQDLLFHLPFRYQDRTHLTPIRNVQVGDHAVVEGVLQRVQTLWGRKPSLVCELSDGSAHLSLRFFHFSAAQTSYLTVGAHLRCFGEIRASAHGITMIHPEYRLIKSGEVMAVEESLTPIYPTTEGLSQQTLRRLTDIALQRLGDGEGLQEYLPPELRQQFQMVNLAQAIHYVHRPPPDAPQALLSEGLHPMQQRLAFEELVAHNLSLQRVRQRVQHLTAPSLIDAQEIQQRFLQQLPFMLTSAQQRVVSEIMLDLAKPHPMLRLIQGDVGSGKTVVAAIALLQAAAHGYQGALMAPTELLAEQHYRNFSAWFEPLGISVAWLSGKLKAKPRREALAAIQSGSAKIVVGTHALFQKGVEFGQLGLVVIDEQHRFGVDQRMALRQKADLEQRCPHQLIMTATPIPRTLAMTAYADLDYSVIDELPPGRIPVTTIVVPNTRRHEVLARVREMCHSKRQAYWVCTLIEESEVLQCQAAEDTATDLQTQLPELCVRLIHGRMSTEEKETVMLAFKQGDIDLLVATTVVEVGVDVQNASLMIIENPERLGLAQLHQLRGRVGRGASMSSHCVLLYQSPLTEGAHDRLAILRETHDGFEIAQRDLELRGPGEVLGTRQTGELRLRIADVLRDKALLGKVQEAALQLLLRHPQQTECLIKRWIGDGEQYGEV